MDYGPLKEKRAYHSRKSLTSEEKLDRIRQSRRARSRRFRAKKKREIGVEAYNKIENERKRKSYIKAADMPLDKLLEFRKKDREKKHRLRQKLKLQKFEREEELK